MADIQFGSNDALAQMLRETQTQTPAWQAAKYVNRLAQENLPGTGIANAGPQLHFPAMNQGVAKAWIQNLAKWREVLPQTVNGLQGFEPTPVDQPKFLAHYRPLDASGNRFMFGYGNRDLSTLRERVISNQLQGHLVIPDAMLPGTEASVNTAFNHELGHALDYRLQAHALGEGGRTPTQAALRQLRGQLVDDALAGKVSDYAKQSAIWDAGGSIFGPQPTRPPAAEWAPGLLRNASKEPFAEAFAKNPAMVDEVLGVARKNGFQGAATPGAMGLGAALLAAPLIAHAIGGKAEKVINTGAAGAGIGSLFGAPGALVGGIGGALAAQLGIIG